MFGKKTTKPVAPQVAPVVQPSPQPIQVEAVEEEKEVEENIPAQSGEEAVDEPEFPREELTEEQVSAILDRLIQDVANIKHHLRIDF